MGSSPIQVATYADLAHLVERHLAKVEVASSSLVIRSRKFVVEIFTAFLLFTDNFPHSVLAYQRCCGFDYETTAFAISVLCVLFFSLSVFLCTKIVIKNLLSDSYRLGSYLDKLVIVNKFKAFFKAHSLIGDKS